MIYFDLDQWQWGSRTNYPDGTKRPFNMDKVVVHWGGYTNPGGGQGDEMAILRGWQRYHIDTKGWTDIAYNFAVGNTTGLVYRLRGVNRSGATSGDYENDGIPENQEALAVVWLGGQGYGISEAARQSMGRVIRSSGQSLVIGHRNVKQTSCPGDEWLDWIDRRGWETETVPAPPPVEGDYRMQTVKRGDGYKANPAKKATVKAAQIMLAFRGFVDLKTEDGTCGADGIFGPGTEAAVKDFQQASRIVIDGQVGPETWKALES